MINLKKSPLATTLPPKNTIFAPKIFNMKRIVILTLIFALSLSVSFAQKKTKTPVITHDQRVTSTMFANGLKDYYQGNFQNAEKNFMNVVQKDSKHATAYYMLGKVKKEAKDYPAAEYFLQQASKNDKSNAWFLSELAEVYDLQGKHKESSAIWSQVCKMQPNNEQFVINCADAYLQCGDVKNVMKYLDVLEQMEGPNEGITNFRVEILLYRNDVKGAVAVYDKLIKQCPTEAGYYAKAANIYISNDMSEKAIPYLEKAIAIDSTNGEAQCVLGSYYYTHGDKDAAFLSHLAAIKSSDVEVDKKLSILRLYLADMNDLSQAPRQLALARALTESEPETMEGWAATASVMVRQKNYEDAVPYFEKALDIDPAQYSLWQDFLYCLAKAKKYDKIISMEKDITEIFPTNGMMNYTLGDAYLQTNHPTEALKYFEKSLKYTYDKNEQGYIYSAMAEAYEALGNAEKAAECRKKGNKK